MKAAVRFIVTAAAALSLFVGCAADRLHRDGLTAIEAGQYEEGIAKLEAAVADEPNSATFRIDLKARREAAVIRLMAAADTARGTGKLDEAELGFRRVLSIEPGNSRALHGLEGVKDDRRHAELIAEAQKQLDRGVPEQADAMVRAVLAEDPGFDAANALRAKIEQARGPVNVVPRLHSRDNRPVTLQFRDANTKMVFEVLSRQTGINFVFDKDVRSDGKTTIFVQQVPVEQAIELVLGQNQLARQVLSDNMVLIYPNNSQKQKEYQDEIVKTIYLTNADPKQAQNLLKTVLNAKTVFIDERANQIVIRDIPETVRMAEKLLASLDLPEPEVMMEVEVLELTRSRLQQLGINYPTAATVAATPFAGDKLHLSDLHKQNADTLTVTSLSASLDLLKQVGSTNVLASPRIRARNKEKAKILIGSRVPVITNTVTPVSTGAPVVTGSVQYLDVGLTLEVEPTIYLDRDVAMKVNLEVSSILKEVPGPNGSLAYQIGTRNATTLLRLKDGETQILAGLINDQDTRSSNHIPGLGDIPILGRLFGSQRSTYDKSEIVLSITPRIIRTQPRPPSEDTEFWYGTESSIRTAPLGATTISSAAATASAPLIASPNAGSESAVDAAGLAPLPGLADAAGASTGSATGDAPATAAAETAAPAPAEPQATTAVPLVVPSGRTPASVPGAPTIAWDAPGQTGVGQDFDVTVRLDGGNAMKSVRAQIHYDPAVLLLTSAEAGDILPADVKAIPRINQIAGVVQFVVAASGDHPAQGSGSLMTLHFKAQTPSAATKVSLQFAASTADGVSIPPTAQAPLTVVVNP